MNIRLSDHFTYKKLIKFTLPSVLMMIFTSIYGVVDGIFISNFAGKTQFAAVNFIMPFLMILGTFGFMFGAGGSALISKAMGEGNMPKANRLFSMLTYISVIIGVILAVLGIMFIRPVASLLGASGDMLDHCVIYGRIILAALPAYMLQMEFQSFFITAEKPHLGLASTVAAGVTNMVLDALFIAVFKWDVAGAAAATAISQVVGGMIPIIYFARPNCSLFRLGKTSFDGRALIKVCTNGSSELMSNISMSLVSMLYNTQLMSYAGEDGVAAYGTLMYVNMIFIAIFIGYTTGSAPIVSYNYGAQNRSELKSVFKKGLLIIIASSICMLILGEALSKPLSYVFAGQEAELMSLTVRGFSIFSFSFLFCGIAIYGSGFFTALNNGLVSALISFLRTLVFQVAAVIILPILFDIDGIWISIVVAELMASTVTAIFIAAMRKKYGY